MKAKDVMLASVVTHPEAAALMSREAERALRLRRLEGDERALLGELRDLGAPILQGLERAGWLFVDTERVRILLSCLEASAVQGFAARRRLAELEGVNGPREKLESPHPAMAGQAVDSCDGGKQSK